MPSVRSTDLCEGGWHHHLQVVQKALHQQVCYHGKISTQPADEDVSSSIGGSEENEKWFLRAGLGGDKRNHGRLGKETKDN